MAADQHLVAARIANFREIGTAFKQVKDELNSKRPDLARVRESARLIKDVGAEIPHWFPPGTEPTTRNKQGWLDNLLDWFGLGSTSALSDEHESRAKIEIWTTPKPFDAAYRTFAIEAQKFWQVAQQSDLTAITVRFRALGKTCESCHEKFREAD